MLIIRKAKKEDIERIIDVSVQAFGQGPYVLDKLLEERYGIIGGKPWEARFGEIIKQYCEENLENILVAIEDNRVIGYSSYNIDQARPGVGSIGYNAVDPAYQGRGIGTELINSAIQRLKDKGIKIVNVVTFEKSKPARRVYEKVGFKQILRSVWYTIKIQ